MCGGSGFIQKKHNREKKDHEILNYTCSCFGLIIYLSKTIIQALSNKELPTVVSMFTVSGNLVENASKFTCLAERSCKKKLSSATDLHVLKPIGKFIEIKQVLIDFKVIMPTNRNEKCTKKLETSWIEILRHIMKGGWRRIPALMM